MVLFSVIWGVGGLVCEKYRNKFNIFLLKLIYYDDIRQSYNIDIDNWEPRGLPILLKGAKNLFNLKLDI